MKQPTKHKVFDLETHEFSRGNKLPRIVCAASDDGTVLDRESFREWIPEVLRSSHLANHNIAYDLGCVVSDQNWLELWDDVVKAYDESRVVCTMILAQLVDVTTNGNIETTGYSLDAQARKHFGLELDKDTYRRRYAEVEALPIDQWDPGFLEYVATDAHVTAQLLERLLPILAEHGVDYELLAHESRTQFVLDQMSARGLATDPHQVESLSQKFQSKLDDLRPKLLELGAIEPVWSKKVYHKPQVGYTRNQSMLSEAPEEVQALAKAHFRDPVGSLIAESLVSEGWIRPKYGPRIQLNDLVIERYKRCDDRRRQIAEDWERESGIILPRTGAGQISLAKETQAIVPDDSVVADLILWSRADDIRSQLEKFRTSPIHGRYRLINSGRSASGGGEDRVNMQNFRRDEGFRECFHARPGYVLCSIDYDSIELRSLAQVQLWWFGSSALAEVINAGQDPHLAVAALLADTDYEYAHACRKGKVDADTNRHLAPAEYLAQAEGDPIKAEVLYFKQLRSLSKVLNFGLPGGLAEEKFITHALSVYKVHIAPSKWAVGPVCPDGYYDIPYEHLPSKSCFLDALPPEVQAAARRARGNNGRSVVSDRKRNDEGEWIPIRARVPYDWVLQTYGGIFVQKNTFAYYRSVWLTRYPEMLPYFARVQELSQQEGYVQCEHCTHKRANIHFTEFCNHKFQHHTSWGAKRGLWYVYRGSRPRDIWPVIFVHDEIVVELPDNEHTVELAQWATEQMLAGMAEALPDVPPTAEPALMYRWSKAAGDPVYDAEGTLIPFERSSYASEDDRQYLARRFGAVVG